MNNKLLINNDVFKLKYLLNVKKNPKYTILVVYAFIFYSK